jgi:hypothetical protein
MKVYPMIKLGLAILLLFTRVIIAFGWLRLFR